MHPDHEFHDDSESGISLGRIKRTLTRYGGPIRLAIALVIIGTLILGLVAYLLAPVQNVVSIPFRLAFDGAEKGEYPNGIKFSTSDIVNQPILESVFKANQLERFTDFRSFSNSIVILESNRELDHLARQYAARLSDPRLSAVDRERIEREYDLKRESATHDQFSINYIEARRARRVPPSLIQKSLNDILDTWARESMTQKGGNYRFPLLTRSIFNREQLLREEPLIAVDILRTRINQVLRNIDELVRIPGAEVLRTPDDRTSLPEIRLRLDNLVRFSIQPMLIRARSAAPDPQRTRGYVEAQLAYVTLLRDEAAERVRALQGSLQAYTSGSAATNTVAIPRTSNDQPTPPQSREALMPQMSESFLDRLVQMSQQSNDVEYRQALVDRITRESMQLLPLETEVSYYTRLSQALSAGSSNQTPEAFTGQLSAATDEAIRSVDQIGLIYRTMSANLNPGNQMLARGGVTQHVERSVSLKQVGMYILLSWLVGIPLIMLGAILHDRMRREEEQEIAHDIERHQHA